MVGRRWTQEGTWELARVYLILTRRVGNPTYKKSRWRAMRWWRRRRHSSLLARHETLTRELSARYEGILREVCSRIMQRSGKMLTENVWRDFFVRTWLAVQDSASRLDDARRFSTSLWQTAMEECQHVLACHVPDITELFKPKFMLRQFVDEMPECEERAALRLLAYRGSQTAHPDDREPLRLLEAAYPLLHQEVNTRRDHLPLLTDGAIPPHVVAHMVAPFAEYDYWLFPD